MTYNQIDPHQESSTRPAIKLNCVSCSTRNFNEILHEFFDEDAPINNNGHLDRSLCVGG